MYVCQCVFLLLNVCQHVCDCVGMCVCVCVHCTLCVSVCTVYSECELIQAPTPPKKHHYIFQFYEFDS